MGFKQVTPERRHLVCRDLAENSDPRWSFFVLVGLSTMIAGLGLVALSASEALRRRHAYLDN